MSHLGFFVSGSGPLLPLLLPARLGRASTKRVHQASERGAPAGLNRADRRLCRPLAGIDAPVAPSRSGRGEPHPLRFLINAHTRNHTKARYTGDEAKRRANLAKHGLDFAQAAEVLEARIRFDVAIVRVGEARTLSRSYALGSWAC